MTRFALRILFLLLVASCALGATGQGSTAMCWNVENLFDCVDDSLTDDEEFLPGGSYGWNPNFYWRKLTGIARTVASVDPHKGWPPLVGLLEVENDTVMTHLTRRSPLRQARYEYVITHGPDARGIDIALMYQPSAFKLLHHQAVRVPIELLNHHPTRDLLHVTGLTSGGDTLHVVLCHLPSRANNTLQSDRHRMVATRTLCTLLDSLADQKVLLMGDFNAEAGDPIFRLLDSCMHHLPPQPDGPRGSYVFRRHWGFIDHILVSHRLLPQCGPHMRVAHFPFLLNPQGHPWRNRAGGTSDHLPILIDIELGESTSAPLSAE